MKICLPLPQMWPGLESRARLLCLKHANSRKPGETPGQAPLPECLSSEWKWQWSLAATGSRLGTGPCARREAADPRCGLRTRPSCALTVHLRAARCRGLFPAAASQGPRPTPTAEQPPSVALRVRGTAGLGGSPDWAHVRWLFSRLLCVASGRCCDPWSELPVCCVWCRRGWDRVSRQRFCSPATLACRHTFSPPALGPFPCLSSDSSRPGLCAQRKHIRFPRTKEGGEKG